MKKYKKVDYKEYESRPFQMSEYFKTLSVSDSRMKLRFNLSMINTVRNNFHNNKRYRSEGYQCIDCADIGILEITDTQEHLLTSACEANSDLCQGRDFSRDEDICAFFRDVIARRQEKHGC